MREEKDMVRMVLDYQRTKDEHLCARILAEYEPLVHFVCFNFYLQGQEQDDLLQEGRIGLYKAICHFDTDRLSSFSSYARLSIQRQCITAMKYTFRRKYRVLQDASSLNIHLFEGGKESILDCIVDAGAELRMNHVSDIEEYAACRRILKEMLTPLEFQVFCLWIAGEDYRGIGKKLKHSVKSVDNTFQRFKKKFRRKSETCPDFPSMIGTFVRYALLDSDKKYSARFVPIKIRKS